MLAICGMYTPYATTINKKYLEYIQSSYGSTDEMACIHLLLVVCTQHFNLKIGPAEEK